MVNMSTLNSAQTSHFSFYLVAFLAIVALASFLTPWLPVSSFMLACLAITPIAIGMRMPSEQLPFITKYPIRRAKSHSRLCLYTLSIIGIHLLIQRLNFLFAPLGTINPLIPIDIFVVLTYMTTCADLAYHFIKYSGDANANNMIDRFTVITSLQLCILYTLLELLPLINIYCQAFNLSIPFFAQLTALPLPLLVIPLVISAVYNLSLSGNQLPEIKSPRNTLINQDMLTTVVRNAAHRRVISAMRARNTEDNPQLIETAPNLNQ